MFHIFHALGIAINVQSIKISRVIKFASTCSTIFKPASTAYPLRTRLSLMVNSVAVFVLYIIQMQQFHRIKVKLYHRYWERRKPPMQAWPVTACGHCAELAVVYASCHRPHDYLSPAMLCLWGIWVVLIGHKEPPSWVISITTWCTLYQLHCLDII